MKTGAKTKMNVRPVTILRLALPFIGAAAILTLVLTSVSWARDGLLTASPAPPVAPASRPHDPYSGVYTMYDTLTPADIPTATYEWVEIRHSRDYRWDLGGWGWEPSNPIPIGFIFPFYDDFYTHFRISERGYIFFEKEGVWVGSGRGWPDLIPNNNLTGTDAANNFIAPFAANLFGYPELSHVYVRSDSNPRRTIIEFENVVWCCDRYNPRTFEIVLYPDGRIDFQYLKITNFAGTLDEDLGRSFVVGLENLDGSLGDVYTQGLRFAPDALDYWQDEMAIRFQPNFTGVQAIFIPDNQAIWDDPGNTITATAHLYLGAGEEVTRSFTLTHTLIVSSSVSAAEWENGVIYPTSIPPITGTYSRTLPVVVRIPSGVVDVDDMATLTITAQSADATPFVSATYSLRYGPAHRDLQIVKTLAPDVPPAEGGALRYRLAILNTDYDDSGRAAVARGVVVTDVLPARVAYEDCRRAYYSYCGSMITTTVVASQTIVTLDLGRMYIDETETVWLELRNTGNGVGTVVSNTARVTTTESVELGAGSNNQSEVTFTVASSATNLAIYKDYPYDDNFVAAGQAVPFNIWFYNADNVPLYGATVVDLLPENTSFDRAYLNYDGPELIPDVEGPITPTIGGPMSRTLTFAIPFIDNGHWNEAHLQVWAHVPQTMPLGTSLTNLVTISHGTDQVSATATIEIASSYIDPFVDKEPSWDENDDVILPAAGQDYAFWINYGNRSMLTDAANVTITDTLPTSVTLVNVSAAPYLTGPVTSVSPEGLVQLTWRADPHLPRGWMGQMAVVVHVDEGVRPGTELANRVEITYTDAVYMPSTTLDDVDVVTVEVASVLERSQKLVDDPAPNAGELVAYTLVVSNASLTNTLSYTVSDALPAELSYVGHYTPTTGTVVADPRSILWTGEVVARGTVTLTFQAAITELAHAGQVIRNTAHISAAGVYLERWREVTVMGSIFHNSEKTHSPTGGIVSGDRITYTLVVQNDGTTTHVVTVTDSLPPSVTLVGGSFVPTTGTVLLPGSPSRVLTWTPSVAGGTSERLDFQVTVTEGLTEGMMITNVAYLDDGLSQDPLLLATAFTIGELPGVYLPIVLRNDSTR